MSITMAYYLIRRRVRHPLQWVLATLLLVLIMLHLCPRSHPYPTRPSDAHTLHRPWWRSYLPVGNSRHRRPPHHGHHHHHEDTMPQVSWTEQTRRLSTPELRYLIAGTNGYYVRDWSVGLGWNNVSAQDISPATLNNSPCS